MEQKEKKLTREEVEEIIKNRLLSVQTEDDKIVKVSINEKKYKQYLEK